MIRIGLCGALLAVWTPFPQDAYKVKPAHPRIFIEDLKALRDNARGPLKEDYDIVRQRADAAVKRGSVEFISNQWAIPEDLMNCGLAYLVEGDRAYADLIVRQWGDGAILSNREGSHFGYHAIAFDWIHDALTAEQRRKFGDALGGWLRYYTDSPDIQLKWGHWEYNQTWGPIHFNVMNARDALAPKLMVALAILGAGTRFEADARAFLDSWNRRVPAECLPAFEKMGGVWSESFGHGGYGPVTVIPYALHAWRTATGIDLLKKLKPSAYPIESARWTAYTMMPHNERTAWIDDGDGSKPAAFARAAPMLRDPLSQWFSDRGRDWLRERWQRVASHDPKLKARAPDDLPLGYLFPGAGHAYMRGAWGSPDAAWAYFGAGPQFAGHSRDDEGHFLICRRGAVVSRAGGQGHNDDDLYSGGSLIYNLCTIYDHSEKFRRDKGNENDGGLVRHVYEGGPFPRERARMTAFEHTKDYTYAAAELTQAYHASKAREVTRQFLYLRGDREYFVVFDRVEATRPEFARHFFLHVPTEPEIDGARTSWLGLPEADGDAKVLLKGRTRAFMHTLSPAGARIVTRGGPGKEAWGHPSNPDAQYNHEGKDRSKPPICPWRIEVADPGRGARTLFFHVIELADEEVRRPTEVRLEGPGEIRIGDRWTVQFNADGKLGGRVGIGRKPVKFAETVKIEAQYE